jgi:hypothetical protein
VYRATILARKIASVTKIGGGGDWAPTYFTTWEPGQLSRYSDWLRAGRRRGRSSCPGRVKNFLFSTSSRPALGPTQPPIQWVPGARSPGVKREGREADYSPPINAEVKKTWVYTSTPPIRLHSVVLNYLSTGTALLFLP